MTAFSSRSTCRSCGAGELVPVLALGSTPLANALLPEDDREIEEERFPLNVVFCTHCALVQIVEDVPPEVLFRDYVYFSSFSDTALENARAIAERTVSERNLAGASLVMEIASNDGYLLQHYVRHEIPVLGIEPARNIAVVARSRGIDTVEEFFTLELAAKLAGEGRRADVIHANNVLAHVSDLNGFVAGIALVLREDGVAIIEVPYVRDLIERLEFDTIYHEHLCYFSLTSLDILFARHGLTIGMVEHIDIHGGSLRFFAGRHLSRSTSVLRLLEDERAWGVNSADSYLDFGDRVRGLCRRLREVVGKLKADGARIAAYGASAKGTTLLSFSGIGEETLDFVADRSTVKQGKRTPGARLPIVAPEELLRRMPDYVLLLTWNFSSEILRQQEEYRRRGGRFIIPLPEVVIV